VTVALKVYKPELLHVISQYQLHREAHLHTQLSHPNVIKMYAAFKQGEYAVMVMEYANGGDLLQLMERYRRRLPEQTSALVMSQVRFRGVELQVLRLMSPRVRAGAADPSGNTLQFAHM
jgi:serine/threonine protein kinase